jgi:allantoinase
MRAVGGEAVMSAADLIVRGRRVLTPDGIRAAAVGIRGGEIIFVGPYDAVSAVNPASTASPASTVSPAGTVSPVGTVSPASAVSAASTVELADDEVLLPGLVDTHVHVNEPGRTRWEGFASATRAAAAGGITTIIDMPLNSIPPTTDPAALRAKRESARGQVHADVGFWGGAVPGNADQLGALDQAGVFGFKCFLADSGVPEFPPLDEAGLARALREVAAFKSLLIVHAEDTAALAAAPRPEGRTYASFLRSRPDVTETAAVAMVIRLARETGGRVHILHLSSAEALDMIAAARGEGLPLTAETCPHYLAFAAAEIPDGATEFKCCPPIRARANRERLWAALGDGVIDCVVSDHSPCPPELKLPGLGQFGAAWGGISSVQVALPVVWTAARARGYQLTDVARWMASGPARVAGLARKGQIAPGCDGDLVAFAPDETFIVDPAKLFHRHRLTPYAGMSLSGIVRRTWLRGLPVRGDQPEGRLLTREMTRL